MSAPKYLITNEEDFELLVGYIESERIFAYDTETNGTFNRFAISLVGISFGFDDFCCYIPLNHRRGTQLNSQYVLQRLKPIFEDPTKRYVAHNAKFDEMVLSIYGIDCRGSGDDTYIMAWLLSEDTGSKGLKSLTYRYLGVQMETYEDVIAKAPKQRGIPRDFDFSKVSLTDALSYASDDAYYTLKLYRLFASRLANQGLLDAYTRVERPFNRVLRNVESRGVSIDRDYLNYADKQLPYIADQVEAAIYQAAGEVFNIGSGKQLGAILFDKLGIGTNVPKTASGYHATDKKTLATYAAKHEIVDNILRRKKIQKTHSTFVKGFKDFIGRDGKVHPSFNGCGTVTGRLSCREPNLQQIEGDEVEDIKVRNFFVPSKGHKFVVADYSQIELRIMAHFSKDENMIEAFLSGRDFHEEVQKAVFKEDFDPTSRKQRLVAKTLNFGVGYGRGPNSIAEQLEITDSEAKKFISEWFQQFQGVAGYKNWLIRQARQYGYIRTLSGRKRRLLPDIRSDDWRARASAERQAFNTKIQGSAADVIKVAMISLEPKLVELNSGIVIQIHDELLIETPNKKCDTVLRLVKDVMEHPLNGKNPLRLPLVTEPKIVERWGDAK